MKRISTARFSTEGQKVSRTSFKWALPPTLWPCVIIWKRTDLHSFKQKCWQFGVHYCQQKTNKRTKVKQLILTFSIVTTHFQVEFCLHSSLITSVHIQSPSESSFLHIFSFCSYCREFSSSALQIPLDGSSERPLIHSSPCLFQQVFLLHSVENLFYKLGNENTIFF